MDKNGKITIIDVARKAGVSKGRRLTSYPGDNYFKMLGGGLENIYLCGYGKSDYQ